MQDKSQEFVDLMTALNKDLTYYVIEPSTRVIGEEGKYVGDGSYTAGYAITNIITGVCEHTSILLPGVIWQAQHLDNTLKSLLSRDNKPAPAQEAPIDDVILN